MLLGVRVQPSRATLNPGPIGTALRRMSNQMHAEDRREAGFAKQLDAQTLIGLGFLPEQQAGTTGTSGEIKRRRRCVQNVTSLRRLMPRGEKQSAGTSENDCHANDTERDPAERKRRRLRVSFTRSRKINDRTGG